MSDLSSSDNALGGPVADREGEEKKKRKWSRRELVISLVAQALGEEMKLIEGENQNIKDKSFSTAFNSFKADLMVRHSHIRSSDP